MAETADPAKIAKELTEPMLRALRHRQTAICMPEAVFARGATTGALRRRGIIKGAMPHAELTRLGEDVCQYLGLPVNRAAEAEQQEAA
jgi:hypothetical protein